MLNRNKSLIVLLITILLSTSCKKEFTTIGNNMIDTPHFEGHLFEGSKVKTYDKAVSSVFSTNNPIKSLGIYKDDVFGDLEADLACTLKRPTALNSDLGDNPTILDVKLFIPYFSHTYTDANGDEQYKLDSIYGTDPIDIQVNELNYLLPSLDPNNNLHTHRSYYSDFDFSPFIGTLMGEESNFTPSDEAYITYKRNNDGTFELDDNGDKIEDEKLSPRMVIDLDKVFFKQKIFDHSGESILTNEEEFKDYFRGIYINAIDNSNSGRFMMLNFDEAKIQVGYTYEKTEDNGDITTIYKSFDLKLSTPVVNTYTNSPSSDMQTALNNSDLINGDADVYVKGDAGAETLIELFDEQELRDFRQRDWMINQAELYVYVDENASQNVLSEPQQLLLYNYDDQQHMIDLAAPENYQNGFAAYKGVLQEDKSGNKYYKFGITRHIRNVLKKDSTNVKLGLRVRTGMPASLKFGDNFIDPDAYNPKGIILYGNQTTVTDKKPVLKIYYSDPE